MQIKTIEKVILNKMNEWLETITDEDLRKPHLHKTDVTCRFLIGLSKI